MNQDPSPDQSPVPASTTTSTTTTPSQNPQTLPPEALDLAARLFNYARQGNTAQLTQYLAAGIPPNLTDHAGNTLLMLAAYHDQADTVRALLAAGADPDALNDRGQSPLAGAVFKGCDEVVRVLWEAGADPLRGHPNARDSAAMFGREVWVGVFEKGR